jgi:hypothetical protein
MCLVFEKTLFKQHISSSCGSSRIVIEVKASKGIMNVFFIEQLIKIGKFCKIHRQSGFINKLLKYDPN